MLITQSPGAYNLLHCNPLAQLSTQWQRFCDCIGNHFGGTNLNIDMRCAVTIDVRASRAEHTTQMTQCNKEVNTDMISEHSQCSTFVPEWNNQHSL